MTKELNDLLLVNIEKGMEITKPYRDMPCRFLTNQLNIHWDRKVPVCCVTFEQKTSTIAQDYLEVPLSELNKRKENHPQCESCSKHGIPPYLLGVDQKEWSKAAEEQYGYKPT